MTANVARRAGASIRAVGGGEPGLIRGLAVTRDPANICYRPIVGSFGSRRAYGLLLDAAKWLLFRIKYLDRWIGHYDSAAVLHNGAFFLGRKPVAR